MGRGKKTRPETLQHAIQRLEKIRQQRDDLVFAARKALAECSDLLGTPAGDALEFAIALATDQQGCEKTTNSS